MLKYLLLLLLISCASVKDMTPESEEIKQTFYVGDWEAKRYVYLYKNQELLEKDILAVLIEQRVGVNIKENGDYDKEVSNTVILCITSEDAYMFEDEDMKNIIGEDNVVTSQFESGYWKPFSNHEIKMFPSISPIQNDYEVWSFRGARSGMFLKRFGSAVLVFVKK